MRYLNSIVGVAVIVMVFCVSPTRFGCFCNGGGTPCEDYGKAAAVFVGTPVAVRTVERSVNAQPRRRSNTAPTHLHVFCRASISRSNDRYRSLDRHGQRRLWLRFQDRDPLRCIRLRRLSRLSPWNYRPQFKESSPDDEYLQSHQTLYRCE